MGKKGFWMDDPVTRHAERKRKEAAMQWCARGHFLDDATLWLSPSGDRKCRKCLAINAEEITKARREQHLDEKYRA